MFTIPGFDPKSLTNDELFDKQFELTKKKILASRISNSSAINQLQAMIEAIEQERRERMFTDRIGSVMLTSAGVVIETDPVLRTRDEQKIETDTERRPSSTPATRPHRKPFRTAHPVKPMD